MTDLRYPLSTKDGMYIPADVIEPINYIEITTATSWGNPIDLSLAVTNPDEDIIFMVDVEYPTGVAFMPDGVTPPPAPVPGQWLGIPAGVVTPPGTDFIIHRPEGRPWMWSIAEKQNQTGYLFVLALKAWNTLTTFRGVTER